VGRCGLNASGLGQICLQDKLGKIKMVDVCLKYCRLYFHMCRCHFCITLVGAGSSLF